MARHGIVLAAGESKRMGESKATLTVGDATLLEQHLCALHAFDCSEIVAVVRPGDWSAANAIAAPLLFRVTIAPAITPSQAASLAVALRRIDLADDDVVAITPVDLLPPARATFARLEESLRGECVAASPRYKSRGGHPVLVRGAALAPYLEPRESAERGATIRSLRDVLEALGDRRARVKVDDPNVVLDFDVPADLKRAGRVLKG